ncbi:hypothetical protein FHG87_020071 [Trinorchestia longiramus]|nr:hypothetical protein FHG87_020071 [Trinorchestia longiramus]
MLQRELHHPSVLQEDFLSPSAVLGQHKESSLEAPLGSGLPYRLYDFAHVPLSVFLKLTEHPVVHWQLSWSCITTNYVVSWSWGRQAPSKRQWRLPSVLE